MDIQDVVSRIKSSYYDDVKPLIDNGALSEAYCSMGYLMMSLVLPNRERIEGYHTGPNTVNSMQLLIEDFENETSSTGRVDMFEACLNQLELAVKSGNKF